MKSIDTPRTKSKFERASVATGATILALAMAACGESKPVDAAQPKAQPQGIEQVTADPVETPEATPTETETVEETETEFVPTLETGLPVEMYKDNPEKLVVDFSEMEYTWLNTGATEEISNSTEWILAAQEGTESAKAFAANLSQPSNEAFANNYLLPNFFTKPLLNGYVERMLDRHNTNVHIALRTFSDSAPYESGFITESESIVVESQDKNTLVISSDWHGYDNSNANDARELLENYSNEDGIVSDDPNYQEGHQVQTFTVVDGRYVLSDYTSSKE